MKKLLITIILLLLIPLNLLLSQNQNSFTVTYSTTLANFDYNREPSKINLALQMKEYIEAVKYKLEVVNHASLFEAIKKMELSVNTNYAQKAAELASFYVDSIQYIEQRESFNTLFLIIEPPKEFNWKLINETKTILGYTCYKATHNREGMNPVIVTAWYCPEIPYQFGPKGYSRLPGLILEIVLGGKTTYTADTINWDDDVWVIKPTTGKKITREALNAMYNTAIEEMKSYDKN